MANSAREGGFSGFRAGNVPHCRGRVTTRGGARGCAMEWGAGSIRKRCVFSRELCLTAAGRLSASGVVDSNERLDGT